MDSPSFTMLAAAGRAHRLMMRYSDDPERRVQLFGQFCAMLAAEEPALAERLLQQIESFVGRQ